MTHPMDANMSNADIAKARAERAAQQDAPPATVMERPTPPDQPKVPYPRPGLAAMQEQAAADMRAGQVGPTGAE